MRIYWAVTVLLLACSATVAAQRQPRVALEGLDPVLLTEGKETPGKETISAAHGGLVYRFAVEETRGRFEKDPGRYSIQLDGACARMGPPTGSNPDAYHVYKNRIYAFGSTECYKLFVAAPEKYLESEQPALKWAATPAGRSRARELVGKAVEAIGGAARLDAVASCTETRVLRRPSQQGERDFQVSRTARFPDEFRIEMFFGDASAAQVAAASGGFTTFRGEGQRIPASFAAAIRRQGRQDLMGVLRARHSAGFDVVHAGSGPAGGATVELVGVTLDGVSLTLGIDPATGRVLSLSYRGRGIDGAFGDIQVLYSDYREVDGLRLPYQGSVTVNGAAQPELSWATRSFAINPPGIEALFAEPKNLREAGR